MTSKAVSIFAILMISPVAQAAIHHVPGEYFTIQAALNAADEGDTVLVAPGVYTGPGNTNISYGQGIALIGEEGSESTIIECQGQARGLFIGGPFDYDQNIVKGFTIRNGMATNGAGAYIDCYYLLMEDLKIQNCVASASGGGIYLASVGEVLVSFCEISGCTANRGGGIYVIEGEPPSMITDTIIRNNTALDYGGGLCIAGYGCSEFLDRASLVGNQPDAVYLRPDTQISLVACIVAFNPGEDPAINTSEWGSVYFDQSCSDVFGNAGGNYGEFIDDPTGSDGNVSLDPSFCDLPGGDLSLYAHSPCLPENNACGVQMGALGLGCEASISISGRILTDRGTPMPGIEVTGPTIAITNNDGEYTLLVPAGWSGKITPSGWFHFNGFEPPSRSYEDVSGNIAGQDFTGMGRHVCEIPADYADIQEAMNAAISGDTLRVAPGTYYPEGRYGINFLGKGVCLMSSDGPNLTTIDFTNVSLPDGEGGFYCGVYFRSDEDSSTVLEGFTLTGIDSPDGYRYGFCLRCDDGAAPMLRDLIITDNVSRYGAGLYSIASSPCVEDCAFINNRAVWEGGAICCDEGSLTVRRTVFDRNRAVKGGAIALYWGAVADIAEVAFTGSIAHAVMGSDEVIYSGDGGANYVYESRCNLSGCLLAGNLSSSTNWENASSGGAIHSESSVLNVNSCTFVDNEDTSANMRGGHLYFRLSSQVNVYNSIFAFAGAGGGIYQYDESSTLVFLCNDVYGNVGGDYLGVLPDQTGINGNISADPKLCDWQGSDYHLEAGSLCLPANNECGVLMGAYGEGCLSTDSPAEATPPTRLFLAQNHPNPFNPKTEIRFGLPAAATVSLAVFDPQGRRVATILESQRLMAGVHRVSWEARDERGRAFASGVYFYRLATGGRVLTGKMVLLD